MIDGEDEICLTPNQRYSKYQIYTLFQQFLHLKIGLFCAGFENIEVLSTVVTTKR